MARTTTEIKNQMTTLFMSNQTLADKYGFPLGAVFSDHFSLVSLENIWFEIMTYATYLLELIFDTHKEEVDKALYNQKSGTLRWYRTKALAFQYGFNLLVDSDEFDNTNATEALIEASKIIKYSAVNESDDESRVIIKIATEDAGELTPITAEQKESFEEYIAEIRYAGVKTTVINYEPDKLFLNLQIYRDPLVIDSNGMSILNGNFPVEDAINEYMKELPFDGAFVIQSFVDKLQKVEGVEIAHVVNIETSWIDPTTNGYGAPVSVPVKTIAQSGYFKVQTFDNISYVV